MNQINKILLVLIFILLTIPLFGKKPADDSTKIKHSIKDTLVFADEYLDTVQVLKKRKINDYSMIGVDYGVTMLGFSYSPVKSYGKSFFVPNYIAVMYTHYEKLFQRYANFAFRAGVAYGHEGFGFEYDEENERYKNDVDGAGKAVITVIEIPAMAGFHFDVDPVKFMAEIGIYGGYRTAIEREGDIEEKYKTSFRDYEYRFDYGFKGGAGVALVFDPIEIHFNALVRWGWQSLYKPDYYSKYYYRYAYPLDVTFMAGIHFQLSKRKGKTSRALREEAKDMVYGKAEDIAR